MEMFCWPSYVVFCDISWPLTFWDGRAPSWGRCWWRSGCGSGRCASRTPGPPDPGSTSTADADSAGPKIRKQSYLFLIDTQLFPFISIYQSVIWTERRELFLIFGLKSDSVTFLYLDWYQTQLSFFFGEYISLFGLTDVQVSSIKYIDSPRDSFYFFISLGDFISDFICFLFCFVFCCNQTLYLPLFGSIPQICD